jgi:hypothetical protein
MNWHNGETRSPPADELSASGSPRMRYGTGMVSVHATGLNEHAGGSLFALERIPLLIICSFCFAVSVFPAIRSQEIVTPQAVSM